MHREISTNDELLGESSDSALYLLTGFLAVLLGLDLWPILASSLSSWNLGFAWPSWSREIFGYRYALIAAVVGGGRVLFNALEALLEGRLGTDLAIAVACIAAILIAEPLVAAEVVFIGLVGECLEAVTFARTQRGIRKLLEVCPKKCWLLRDGSEVAVFTSEVQVDDRVVVKPGKKVPVDGVVIEGRSAVDASMLTGESLPVDKGPGDEILAGSINQFGQLIVEARRIAEASVAGQVIALTAKALKDKSPTQREVDRLARYFLPAVLGLALLSFLVNLVYLAGPFRSETTRLGWSVAARLSVYPALGVLVVACPCALILATPAAVIAALGRLAGTGILIKGGSVLERLAKVDTFAFDKTGTLTEGKLELGDAIPVNRTSFEKLLSTAASAEQGSEHPLGQMIVREALARSLVLSVATDFRAFPGAGVIATVSEKRILVGTRRLFEEHGITIPAEMLRAMAQLDERGQSSLLVAEDDEVLGILGARDRIRPEAVDLIAELRSNGITRIMLLTGDRTAVANAVASQLGIDEVHAELLPADKAERIADDRGAHTVCFVGDGINDAPALARASVGIAVGGSDLAAEAGDLVMMGDPLRHLPLLLRLSRETMKILRQNIVRFAFGVNLVGVLIAGILWPFFATSSDWYDKSPLFGVIYHQLGSLLVLLNSMRLLGFERIATSETWKRFSIGVATTDLWLQRNLNVDTLLHELSHRWRWLFAGAAVIGIVVWSATGLVAIAPHQVGVLQRFGRVEAILEPGLHVRWPWPIENVVLVAPQEVKSIGIGYRSLDEEEAEEDRPRKPNLLKPGDAGQGATWTTAHGGSENYEDEAAMITGDGNLVELLATVHYCIDDPKQYVLAMKRRKPLLRSACEAVLREMVSGQTFADLLTVRRADFEREAGQHLERRLRELTPDGLGIRLTGVVVHDLHPPKAVVADYYEVARAIQSRDRLINEAQAEATRKRRRAEEDAIRLVNAAATAANEKVGNQRAEISRILALREARSHLQTIDEATLFAELNAQLLLGQPATTALASYLLQRERIIPLRRSLIDMRLTWDALTEVLRKRDKVIIDIDKIPGRRHLFLIDPDWLRPAMTVPPVGRSSKSDLP